MKIHKLVGLPHSREMGLTVPDKHDFLTKNTFIEMISPKSTTPSSSAAAGAVHTKPCVSLGSTWAADCCNAQPHSVKVGQVTRGPVRSSCDCLQGWIEICSFAGHLSHHIVALIVKKLMIFFFLMSCHNVPCCNLCTCAKNLVLPCL